MTTETQDNYRTEGQIGETWDRRTTNGNRSNHITVVRIKGQLLNRRTTMAQKKNNRTEKQPWAQGTQLKEGTHETEGHLWRSMKTMELWKLTLSH